MGKRCGCCPRVTSGHAATAPINTMNSRRLIRPPCSSGDAREYQFSVHTAAVCLHRELARATAVVGQGSTDLVSVAEAKEPLTDWPMGETCHELTRTHAAKWCATRSVRRR